MIGKSFLLFVVGAVLPKGSIHAACVKGNMCSFCVLVNIYFAVIDRTDGVFPIQSVAQIIGWFCFWLCAFWVVSEGCRKAWWLTSCHLTLILLLFLCGGFVVSLCAMVVPQSASLCK